MTTAYAGGGYGSALGTDLAPARDRRPSTPGAKGPPVEQNEKLIKRLMGYISMSDRFEEQRRKTDRTGGNLYYGRHWNVQVATNRAALTCNIARALIDHKIAIMTKQQPIPVVEATMFEISCMSLTEKSSDAPGEM